METGQKKKRKILKKPQILMTQRKKIEQQKKHLKHKYSGLTLIAVQFLASVIPFITSF